MIKSWDELTVGDFLKIKVIGEENISDADKNLKVAALLGGITYDEILNLPISDTVNLMDNSEFLFKKPKSKRARKKYVINGKTYILLKNEFEMTTAQYINFQNLSYDGFEKHIPEMLAIFLVPEGHTYNDGYDQDEVVEDMMNMSVTEAYGIADFFTKRYIRLTRCTAILLRLKVLWLRLTAPKEQKEWIKAMNLQMKLMMEELL